MIEIKRLEYNFFGVATYIVWDSEVRHAVVVDPGMMNRDEQRHFDSFISSKGLEVTHLVNTHLHIDHTLGNDYVASRYGIVTEAHPADAPLGAQRGSQAEMFRLPIARPEPLVISRNLADGDRISLDTGNSDDDLRVISVPGHSPGSIALYCKSAGWVIAGDALFQGSIGRTDLPGGDYATLIESIRSRLLTLPPSTVVYPGHGPATTIGAEIRGNRFL